MTPTLNPSIEIAGRKIGPGEPAYIIAEMSANHGGSLEHAKQVLRTAAACGVDAVKLQTYTPDTLTIHCDAPPFQVGEGTLWAGRTLYDLYEEAHTPWEWQPVLKQLADELGMALFSTPFDATAVEFLEQMDVPAYKIASFEIIDHALVDTVARTGKPIILSTGMASLAEIHETVAVIRQAGGHQLALLKCTSAYPAPASAMNLRTIPHLAQAFGVPVGLSDHTMGTAVPVAAVSLGACIVEKHFCLSRSEGGPDSSFSLEPEELAQLVRDIRTAEQAVGEVHYAGTESESTSGTFRRSLFVVQDIAAGEAFTPHNVRSIRPGDGLPPKFLPQILGRTAATDLTRGTPLGWDMVAGVCAAKAG